MNLRIHERAAADLIDGVGFYERQGAGLGDYFRDSIYLDIESLRLFAGIHHRVFGYHKMLSKVFPYSIYYKVEGDTVNVWRVLDCRRDPRWIERQVRMRAAEES